MARNADKNDSGAGAPYLRLVKDPEIDHSTTEAVKKKYKSAFAQQMDQFADALDAEIELIKSW